MTFTELIISTQEQRCDSSGTTAKLIMTFTTDPGTYYVSNSQWILDAHTYGIEVESWGKLQWAYNLDDMLLVPGEVTMTLTDKLGILKSIFLKKAVTKGVESIDNHFTFRVKVEIQLAGVTEYIGFVKENGVKYSAVERKLTINADTNMQLLNLKRLYKDDGTPLDPMLYADPHYISVKNVLSDLFRVVNPSISPDDVEIWHDWTFRGARIVPNDGVVNTAIPFKDLFLLASRMYFKHPDQQDITIETCGDLLREMAINWCSFAGMIHYGKPFFKKMYSYGIKGEQTLGTVIDRIYNYNASIIDYVEIGSVDIDTPMYVAFGTDTIDQSRRIRKNLLNSFHAAGEGGFSIPTDSKVQAMYNGNYNDQYLIDGVRDELLYPFVDGGFPDHEQIIQWKSNANMVAKFWAEYRMGLRNNRIDLITVDGTWYDLLKDFPDDGNKYQPIGLTKDIDEGTSEFQGLYIGEV